MPKRKSVDTLARTVLNSLSAHIAILDEDGVILETNKAWQRFAAENAAGEDDQSIGVNYVALCEAASGPGARDAHNVAKGIRQVIEGRLDEFLYDYPCHCLLYTSDAADERVRV